jgi:hypothetical protein
MDEPVWTNSQEVEFDPSSIKSTDITPTIATGIFVRLLEAHFSDQNNIRNQQIKDYLWADNETNQDITTKIKIVPGYKYDPRALEMSPAIYVRRDAVMSNKFSIGGKALTHLEPNGNYRGDMYLRALSGTHSIHCVAKGAFNSESLAEEVFYRMMEYTPSIKQDLMFGEFEVKSLSPVKKMEDDKDYFVTQVDLIWQVIHVWELLPIAPILKSVRFTATV